jgi:pyruvate kinase
MQNNYPELLSKQFLSQHSKRRTKIVATIGPASESEEMIAALIDAGMNVARFNTKHNEPEWHLSRIQRVRKVSQEMGKHIAILLDLQGPEIRVKLVNNKEFSIQKNEQATLVPTGTQTDDNRAIGVPNELLQSLSVGKCISIGDGSCEFEVAEVKENEVKLTAQDDFTVKDSKTLNAPGIPLDMPSLTTKDVSYLDAIKNEKVEFVGLSFVRNKQDIELLRQELSQRQMDSAIVAKIEVQQALDNLSEIVQACESVMVARGDLGVEVPFYEVPHWQKVIIQECRKANKPVITATQMMLSMINNPKPTRAEVTDVATAVYDGTDATMLSEESAMGKYPAKTVQAMAQILEYHEQFV